MAEAKTAVIVLNWKGADDTLACVESLMQSAHQPLGIIVCDNASPDDSVARIVDWSQRVLPGLNAARVAGGHEPFAVNDLSARASANGADLVDARGGPGVITIIQTGGNLGYAGGNNVGLRYALGEGYNYFWVLNNDTEVAPSAIGAVLARMAEDRAIGLCGSTLIYHSRRDLIQIAGGARFDRLRGYGFSLGQQQPAGLPIDRDTIEAQLDYVSGAAMMASRAFLDEVGLMQDDYFLYWEELDWAMRAKGRFKLGYAPGSIVYHKVGASIGTEEFGDNSPLSDFYLTRNRVRVCMRFSKVSLPFTVFDVARSAMRWSLRGRWDRARLLLRALVGLPYEPSRNAR